MRAQITVLSRSSTPQAARDDFAIACLESCARPGIPDQAVEILSEGLRSSTVAERFKENRKALIAALTAVLRACNTQAGQEPAKIILDIVEGMALRAVFARRKITTADLMQMKLSLRAIAQQANPKE